MEIETRRAALLRFLRPVLIIQLVVFVVVGVICWFVGWRSLDRYRVGLILAGCAALLFGFGSLMGRQGTASAPTYQGTEFIGPDDSAEYERPLRSNLDETFGFLVMMTLVAGMSAGCGALIRSL